MSGAGSRFARPYYQDTGRRPFLFYAVIGGHSEELRISRAQHRVEEMPDGLELSRLQRPKHDSYIDELLGGHLGNVLERQDPELYQKAVAAESWLVLYGEVQEDRTLDYLRNAIGVVQAAAETGATAILDLPTLSLYSSEQWESNVFQATFRPCEHAVILGSPNPNGTFWFHTRGMRKFGRPDIGLENVPADQTERAAAILNQMIYYGALGAIFPSETGLHIGPEETCLVHPILTGDLEDPDYNNEHYQLDWNECEFGTGAAW